MTESKIEEQIEVQIGEQTDKIYKITNGFCSNLSALKKPSYLTKESVDLRIHKNLAASMKIHSITVPHTFLNIFITMTFYNKSSSRCRTSSCSSLLYK